MYIYVYACIHAQIYTYRNICVRLEKYQRSSGVRETSVSRRIYLKFIISKRSCVIENKIDKSYVI